LSALLFFSDGSPPFGSASIIFFMMGRWNYQHSSLYWFYRIGQFSKPRQSLPPCGHCPHILDSQARRLPCCIRISVMQGHPDSPFLIEKYLLGFGK